MDNFIDKLAQKFTAGEVIRANQVAEEKELRRLRGQVAEYEKYLGEFQKIKLEQEQAVKQLDEVINQISLYLKELTNQESENITKKVMEQVTVRLEELMGKETKQIEDMTAQGLEDIKKISEEGLESIKKISEEGLEGIKKISEESLEGIRKISEENHLQLQSQQENLEQRIKEREVALEKAQATTEEMAAIVKQLNEMLDKNQNELIEKFKESDDYLHKENVKVYRNVQAVVVDETAKQAESFYVILF